MKAGPGSRWDIKPSATSIHVEVQIGDAITWSWETAPGNLAQLGRALLKASESADAMMPKIGEPAPRWYQRIRWRQEVALCMAGILIGALETYVGDVLWRLAGIALIISILQKVR
jgi:hypothetical protein